MTDSKRYIPKLTSPGLRRVSFYAVSAIKKSALFSFDRISTLCIYNRMAHPSSFLMCELPVEN
jgi:hypothetical protein